MSPGKTNEIPLITLESSIDDLIDDSIDDLIDSSIDNSIDDSTDDLIDDSWITPQHYMEMFSAL